MDRMEITPQMQNQLAQFEQLRVQLQMISNQRLQMDARLREIERAVKELEGVSKGTPVYKNLGLLLVKAKEPKEVMEDLNEKKETLGIRVKTLERQEDQLKERYESLQKELTKAVQDMQFAGGGSS